MSKSFAAPYENELDSDASAANTATNGDDSQATVRYQTVLQLLNNTPKFTAEWFRLKEEEVQLRSHPDIEESRCVDRYVDSSKVADGGKVDDVHVREADVKQISMSDSNRRAINTNVGSSAREKFPYHWTGSQQTTKIRAKDRNDNNISAIPDNLLAASSIGSNAKKSDSPSYKEGKERIKIADCLESLTAHASHFCDATDELKHSCSNAGIDVEGAIETLSSIDDEHISPNPSSLHNYTCADEQKSKKNSAIVALVSTDEESPPTPLNIRFVDHAITEKMSRNDSKTGAMPEHASSEIQPPLEAESNYTNEGQVLFNEDIVQQSRAMHPEVNSNYGLLPLSPPVYQRDCNLPRANTNVLSQSMPNDRRLEEEFKEDVVVISDAFIFEANTPMEVPDVGVAEVVEPDLSTFPFKKRHACVVSILFAAIVVALGVTVYFRKFKPPSTDRAESPVILSPSVQPTFLPPSTQPSLIQPSMQPSLSVKDAIEKNVLQRNATFDVLEYTDSRVLALDWIIRKDKKLAASDENLYQRYILVVLAFEYLNLGWITDVKSDGNECNWLGVVCDEDGHVIKLMLDDNSLDGTIPPEIGSLGYLEMLSMSGNSLSETLPYELGHLRNMSELYLDANKFTGPLPSEIGYLKKLTALDLSGNDLTGTLPSELGTLIKLTKLSFESNRIDGTLPSELGNLIELTTLILSGNLFSGTLPQALGNLNKLTEVDFHDNQLSGILPSEFGNLSNLTQLKLSYNYFTGPLPSELGNLNILSILEITKNQFTGTLPSELGTVKKLTKLWLDINQFTGILPSELGNLKMMTELIVSVNRFNGTLPTEIGNLEELFTVSFDDNMFTGTLPTELGRLKMLDKLYLFSNKFVGTLPSELGHLTALTSFSMYSNRFTGTLPSWIGDFTELSEFDVGGNRFVGTLPSELGLLQGLTHFRIDKNEFTGTLPSWLGDLRGLSLLWVNNNQFTGTFPPEIENNLDLTSFCVSSNNFTGSLPAEIQETRDCQYRRLNQVTV